MCGIVGYTGNKECIDILIEGLKNLEYRGYDSAGVAVIKQNGSIEIKKKQGRVRVLEKEISGLEGRCGIGHTRWATHGGPSDVNSHPHFSGKFAVVHNGIIENFLELKVMLVNEGVHFLSETDTEVIAHLLNRNYKGDFIKALKESLDMLKGAYALAIICSDFPEVIAVAKKDNPLIIGVKDKECFISSDIPAIANKTKDIFVLKDGEMALCNNGKVTFYDTDYNIYERELEKVDGDCFCADKGHFESYMIKEINDIPEAIERTFNFLNNLTLPKELENLLTTTKLITIVACGTAYNSGLVGKYAIEKMARLRVNTEIASEYRYKNPIFDKDEIFIAVSQSGETADTIAALKLAKKNGVYTVAITNVSQSSITNIADFTIPIKAGTEVAVAATKSYNCQLVAMYYLANKIMQLRGIPKEKCDEEKICQSARKLIVDSKQLIEFAGHFHTAHSVFFIGRGLDYAVAVEGSLKLKEISYIHSEGYAAGELKHGTLALIEKDTLVVVLMTDKELSVKTLNALHEVKARGAAILVVSQYPELGLENDLFFKLPKLDDVYMPLLEVIPLQMFAYYMARSRGLDPDKPRNLAKSVTVE